MFSVISHRSNTDCLRGLLKLDDTGHVLINGWMPAPRLFADGDGVTPAIKSDRHISDDFGDWRKLGGRFWVLSPRIDLNE